MNLAEAAGVLGVAPQASPEEVRQAYRRLIRVHHPDRAGATGSERAATITEAYRVLRTQPSPNEHATTASPPPPPPRPDPPDPPGPARAGRTQRRRPWAEGAPPVARLGTDALLVDAPADETFRWLLEAAHDVGEITYVDRSMPIAEVLCRFEGEPATSLVLTLQGRGTGTEVFCTVESIESRPAPPVGAVVDLLELALHRRRDDVADVERTSGGDQPPSPPAS